MSATIKNVDHPEHRIDGERLDTAMRKAGFVKKTGALNDAKLAKRVGVWASNIKRWRTGYSTPAGDNIKKLCIALGVTAEYLFGEAEGDRVALLAQVRRMFGRAEADAVEYLQRLTPHHRAIAAGRLQGWVEGLEEQERQAGDPKRPITPFDVDRERLSEEGDGDGEGAGGAPAPPAAQPDAPR